jgi:hypothetical protein
MENVKQVKSSNTTYYLVSDYVFKATGVKRAITGIRDLIPKEHIYNNPNKRGAKSGVYATIEGIKEMVSKMPRFPLSEKEKLGIYNYTCCESEFIYIITGLFTELGIDYKTQYPYKGFNIDICLPKYDIAIEFDEKYHYYKNEMQRLNSIKETFNLIQCQSHSNIGVSIAKILMLIKQYENTGNN